MTPARRFRLTPGARSDLRAILAWSAQRFGPTQRRRYALLLSAAMARIAEAPLRPASMDRGDLAPGLRSYAVSLAAGRRRAAVHVVFYRSDTRGIRVIRILHESMDPARHLGAAEDAP